MHRDQLTACLAEYDIERHLFLIMLTVPAVVASVLLVFGRSASGNGEFAPFPQASSPEVHCIDSENAQSRQPGQKTNTTINSQSVKHWSREKNGPSGECASCETVCGKQGASVPWVGEWKVDKHALDDDKHPKH